MKKSALAVTAVLIVLAGSALIVRSGAAVHARGGSQTAASSGQAVTAGELDGLLAPIALYPDQLLAQILMCATDPSGVTALDNFLKSRPTLKGTELQDAALKDNFQPSFVALALFPQIVNDMALLLTERFAKPSALSSFVRASRSCTFDATLAASISGVAARRARVDGPTQPFGSSKGAGFPPAAAFAIVT